MPYQLGECVYACLVGVQVPIKRFDRRYVCSKSSFCCFRQKSIWWRKLDSNQHFILMRNIAYRLYAFTVGTQHRSKIKSHYECLKSSFHKNRNRTDVFAYQERRSTSEHHVFVCFCRLVTVQIVTKIKRICRSSKSSIFTRIGFEPMSIALQAIVQPTELSCVYAFAVWLQSPESIRAEARKFENYSHASLGSALPPPSRRFQHFISTEVYVCSALFGARL